MAANGDVYQVIDTSVVEGQKCLNVYFYQLGSMTLGFGAADVTAAFVDQVLPDVVACQNSQVVHTEISARNLFDEADAHTQLVSVAGVDGGDFVGTFEAMPFRLVGDNAAVRNGAKRYVGVTESRVTSGVVDAAPELAALATLGDQLSTTLDAGLLDAARLAPAIIKRLLVGGHYVLPSSPEELVISFIVDALFSALVSSQTSRKIGSGE